MEVGVKRHRVRLAFDPKDRFPDKLYAVACDAYIVKWSKDGTAVTVGEELFEKDGMLCYPGFVQIPTFVNLRRLFREYSFTWSLIDEDNLIYEFSHPLFIKDCIESLASIKTKRKSYPEKHRNSNKVQMKKQQKRQLPSLPNGVIMPSDAIFQNGQIIKCDPSKIRRLNFEQFNNSNPVCSQSIAPYHNAQVSLKAERKERYNEMMNNFARNEMNVTEYEQYLQSKTKSENDRASSHLEAESSNDSASFSNSSVNQSHPTYFMTNNTIQAGDEQIQAEMPESDIANLQQAYIQQPFYKQPAHDYDWGYQNKINDVEDSSVTYSDNDQQVTDPQLLAKQFGQCPTFQADQGCSCCKHCNGCHHVEQSNSPNQSYSHHQLGSGDSSISYYNL